jgi:predicted transcriptional regulator
VAGVAHQAGTQKSLQRADLEGKSSTQKILAIASEEPVTMARICLLADLEYKEAKELVETMIVQDLLISEINEAGLIKYRVE